MYIYDFAIFCFGGIVHERGIVIANALEIPQRCTWPFDMFCFPKQSGSIFAATPNIYGSHMNIIDLTLSRTIPEVIQLGYFGTFSVYCVWLTGHKTRLVDRTNDKFCRAFSCDQAALWMVQSVRPSVTPFSLFSHHRIIMNFSGIITNDRSEAHAKGQGYRSKVKVAEVTNLFSRFRTVTTVWIHI